MALWLPLRESPNRFISNTRKVIFPLSNSKASGLEVCVIGIKVSGFRGFRVWVFRGSGFRCADLRVLVQGFEGLG